MHMLVRRDIAVGSQVAAYMYGPLTDGVSANRFISITTTTITVAYMMAQRTAVAALVTLCF